MGKTAIEWTDKSWNPIRARNRETGKTGWYCQKVSPACKNCYAERMNLRVSKEDPTKGIGNGIPYAVDKFPQVEMYLDEKELLAPLRWKKPASIFPCSMTDLFASWVPDAWLDKIYAVMALTPQHTYNVLTKRPERRREYLSAPDLRQRIAKYANVVMRSGQRNIDEAITSVFTWGRLDNASVGEYVNYLAGITDKRWPLPNVREGISVCNQEEVDKFIPILLDTEAALRWLSIEPMLGPIDLQNLPSYSGIGRHLDALSNGGCHDADLQTKIDWVVCGGESGPGARPMHPEWAESLRDQCGDAKVPFFFKQWGEWAPGACANKPPVRTEIAATWFGGEWDYERITVKRSEDICRDDEPTVYRLGKKSAGRLLDGREWNEMPEVRR